MFALPATAGKQSVVCAHLSFLLGITYNIRIIPCDELSLNIQIMRLKQLYSNVVPAAEHRSDTVFRRESKRSR